MTFDERGIHSDHGSGPQWVQDDLGGSVPMTGFALCWRRAVRHSLSEFAEPHPCPEDSRANSFGARPKVSTLFTLGGSAFFSHFWASGLPEYFWFILFVL